MDFLVFPHQKEIQMGTGIVISVVVVSGNKPNLNGNFKKQQKPKTINFWNLVRIEGKKKTNRPKNSKQSRDHD